MSVRYNKIRIANRGILSMLALVSILLFVISGCATPPESGHFKVVKVVDGDTVHLMDYENNTAKVRLHGIDTPEMGQPYGRAAKNHLASMIGGESVRIIPLETDRYGRLIAKIYHKDVYVNLAMVQDGYAWWYERYAKYEFKFRTAQYEAKKQGLGLWSTTDPIPPWEWRRGAR